MPFKKVTSGKDKGKYKSPTGRVMTAAQVRAYYAKKDGKGKGRKSSPSRSKKKP